MSESSASAVVAGLSWDAALRRSEGLVVAAYPEEAAGRWSWDGTSMRDLVAFALYAVGLRDRVGIDEVPLGRAVVPLFHRDDFERLVRAELTTAGHRLDDVDPVDPVSVRWAWLHRGWDPEAPVGQRWDGLTRGIARGLPDPAIVVCLNWAGGVVDHALAAERGALARRAWVQITGGAFGGQTGRVETPAWLIAPDRVAVEQGSPGGYMIRLDRADEVGPVERIPAADLEPAQDHTP